jgi:hypothetical protein
MNEHEHTPQAIISEVLDDFCARHGLDRVNIDNAPRAIFPPLESYVLYKGKVYQYVGQERYRRVSLFERVWLWATRQL